MATVEERAGEETRDGAGSAVPLQAGSRTLSSAEAEQLVLTVLRDHADALLRTARKHSLSPDDAQDAYQRGLEIMLRHARRLDPDRAHSWLHTVVKHEAMAVRRVRQRDLAPEEIDFDLHQASDAPGPDEQAVRFDRVRRSAEALKGLKPHELQALWLKAEGHSYAEIAERKNWTNTKVNRCIAEGRKSFLARYADLESGEQCARWDPVISAMVDGEADAKDAQALRGHLRGCPACRATLRAVHESGSALRGVLPVGAVAGEQLVDRTDAASNLLLRLFEALAGGVHDRATLTVTRFHGFLEGASTAKVAAAATAAVAVTGGSVATIEHAREPHREPAKAAKRQPARTPAATPAAVAMPASTANVAPRVAVATATATSAATRRRAAERAKQRRAEAKARAAKRRVSRPVTSGAAGNEFDVGAPARPSAPGVASSVGGGSSSAKSPTSSAGAFGP